MWSNELAHRGIRVNSLALGPVATNLRRLSIEEQVEFENSIVEQLPLGRAASAQEQSSYITGKIPVEKEIALSVRDNICQIVLYGKLCSYWIFIDG